MIRRILLISIFSLGLYAPAIEAAEANLWDEIRTYNQAEQEFKDQKKLELDKLDMEIAEVKVKAKTEQSKEGKGKLIDDFQELQTRKLNLVEGIARHEVEAAEKAVEYANRRLEFARLKLSEIEKKKKEFRDKQEDIRKRRQADEKSRKKG